MANPHTAVDRVDNPAAVPARRVTVREAVIELLRELGMTTVFGNPGSTELPLFRDFPDDFRYVLGLQESVVVGMADGYAQATRNAALVNLHSAAGVGHAMGNIFTAYRNRTPLVITAGQQARSILPYEPFLFATQATKLPEPYVKWSSEPARGEDVPGAIARAYHIAMQAPCGPDVRLDSGGRLGSATEPVAAARSAARCVPTRRCSTPLATALDRSTRPVFVVGAGVDRDGAWDEVVALAERHQALGVGEPDVVALQLPGDASAVRRIPAGDPRADRQVPRRSRPRDRRPRRAGVHLSHRRLRTAHAAGQPSCFRSSTIRDVAAWTPRRHGHRVQRPPSALAALLERSRRPRRDRAVGPRARRRAVQPATASRWPI